MAIYKEIQLLIRDYAGGVIYLFSHDTRNFASSIVLARKALTIERATLLRKLETDVLLIDRRTHRAIRATSSSGSEHEAWSQLGTTSRSQNFVVLLSGESSKSRGGEALRKGATLVILLLPETGIALNLAIFVGSGIFHVFHHNTQVRGEGCQGIVAIRSTNRGSFAMSLVDILSRAGPSLHARLEDGGVGREGRYDLGLRDVGGLNCRGGGLEVSDNTLKRRQGITRLGTGRRNWSARV
jgi:hypothetical protein